MTARGPLGDALRTRPIGLERLDDPSPHARLLANGTYAVLLTGAGAGVSALGEHRLTAWSADRTEDGDGFFVYLRDRDDGRFWSAGAQPVAGRPDAYVAAYAPGCMTLERTEHDIASRLEVCVSPSCGYEVRRITLRNGGARRRTIEITTYAEIVLQQPAAHAAHPAFQKLFVETAHDAGHGVLLARRRPRSADERHPGMLHALLGPGTYEHETDRARFVGRGRTLAAPRALVGAEPLSGTVGSVLDPVLSLRRVVVLEPGATATLHAVLAAAATRDELLALAPRLRPGALDETFAAAAEHERASTLALGPDAADAEALQDVAGAMLYGDPSLRAPAAVLRRACGGSAALAALSVRRDARLVVARVAQPADVDLIGALLRARQYWQAHGVAVEIFALCTGDAALAARVTALADMPAHAVLDDAALDDDRRAALLAAARWVLPGGDAAAGAGSAAVSPLATPAATNARRARPEGLRFFDGRGDFAAAGREYVLRLGPGERPPMPWVNVLANERFGCLVSESGAGNTWSRNSRENRLTPWLNDPVCDGHGEALYVRDEDAHVFWSPLPGPAPSSAPCEIRHGLGASTWRQTAHELEQEVVTFVPCDDPVRVQRIRITDRSGRRRRLSVFAVHRLVLGVLPGDDAGFVASEIDAASGALLARNRMNEEFADGVVFATAGVSGAASAALHCCANRGTFLGRNGSPATPAALCRQRTLDGAVGAGLDPCAALQLAIELEPHATVECVFVLGEATTDDAARTLALRYRDPARAARALQEVLEFWHELTTTVQVTTPSPALDRMLNGWLLYQTLACRMWGRTAFYQSGGAVGFRDQLQDSSAFILARPALARAQLLVHAAHQFVEGDVLHWWHPPTSRGIRTRFSDDLCWLAWLTARYVRATGDWKVLDERAGYVTARALEDDEDEAYLLPTRDAEQSDLYDHCCRALDRSLTRGAHGLPLMGTGDWNDGMNRVGRDGRGESVWMAFFLHRILEDFVPLCERRSDAARIARYRDYQAGLRPALESHAWDGAWYRRAYYDDGSTLGSAGDLECRIDALAQAWAVLSGAVPVARAAQAMDAVEEHLVDEAGGLIRLLTPPFDRDPHDPGYIKGYLPGIRENGGQYTHAALWVVQAMAELGRRDRAAALLEMLTPVRHAATPADVAIYQVEPYVVAADVYGVAPHVGRGGWTWYTGSSGWMYRIALETILGVQLENGDALLVRPRIPDAWPGFTVELRLDEGRVRYLLEVVNGTGHAARVVAALLDERAVAPTGGAARLPLLRDGVRHRARIELGA